MAEMVRSAVAEEIAKQIVSGVLDRQKQRRKPNEKEHLERLELAHIKLEAALETSGKWQIRDASLLRWRNKLKRAARECDDTLRRCKQRAVAVAVDDDDDHQEEKRPRRVAVSGGSSSSSLPTRLAHATKSLVSSILSRTGFDGGDDDDRYGWNGSGSAVRRFEWFADGAAEFLRFVELGGGTPWRRYTFVDPLIARLLGGDEARYRLVVGSQYYLFCLRPMVLEGRGTEAKLIFFYEDDDAPEKNMCIGSMLRISESTDIVGATIKCLQLLVTPHFKSTAEAATRKLASLPTQDFSWVPYGGSADREHWDSIHRDMSQWFRSNPLCCNQHEESHAAAAADSVVRPSQVSVSLELELEPVISVYWQYQIPLSEYNMLQGGAAAEGPATCPDEDTPYLKLGLLFTPHGSLGDLTPKAESSALEVIDGEEQHGTHTNLSLKQLDETMLPKALQCLHQKTEAMVYQMLWKSKHGAAYLQVGKTTTPHRNWRGDNKRKRLLMQRYRQDPKLERWTHVVTDFLKLWIARAPDDRLRRSMTQWLQRANGEKRFGWY